MNLWKMFAGKLSKEFVTVAQKTQNLLAPGTRKVQKDSITLLNEYFDKIYVVTIPRNHERHAHIKASLAGLNYEFFYGVDAKNTSPEELYRRYDREMNQQYWQELTPNYLACSLSHAVLYEKIVAEKTPRVLIFEDDAVFEKPGHVGAFLENLPADWEVVRMGYGLFYPLSYLGEPLEYLIRLFAPRFRFPWIKTRTVAKYVRTAYYHCNTVAYGVTYEGAKKLVKEVFPIHTNADHFLDICCDRGVVKTYIATPRIFHEGGLVSTLL